jgi:uncharacterized protein (DUF2267 family)
MKMRAGDAMSESGPFAAAVDHANHWVDQVATAMGGVDRHCAWSALRAVLQVVRDHVPHENAAHFAAQLPLVLRGGFYEGWRPVETPVHAHHASDFLGEIAAHMGQRRSDQVDVEQAFHAVIAALGRCGMEHELAHIQRLMPMPIRELWQAPVLGNPTGA